MINKPSKVDVTVSSVIFLWILAVNIGALVVTTQPTWPMFFVTIFFFTMGADNKKIPNIFGGALMGLTLALLMALAIENLAPSFGIFPVISVVLFIILGLVIVGGCYLPVVFSNVTFAYLTIATINIELIGSQFRNWVIMLLIGGAVILGGCLILTKLLFSYFAGKARAEEDAIEEYAPGRQ